MVSVHMAEFDVKLEGRCQCSSIGTVFDQNLEIETWSLLDKGFLNVVATSECPNDLHVT